MWHLALLQSIICLSLILALIPLSIFGLNNFILLYFRVRPSRSRITLIKPIHIEEWPTVTIQVATYNEGEVVSRLLQSCLKLDYPMDKLEIIIVDDSTDETIQILRDYEWRYSPRVKVIHRSERVGYKAGALNEALKHSRGDFILVLDADSVPEPDFLKRTIPLLLADSRLGFVQGKAGYINASASWLTRAFALINDWYANFSQSALSNRGMIMSFTGHAGVFRRSAIEDVGGWMSDTIAEDMDMAYRLQLRGWKAMFVEDAISLEEVPPRYYSAVKRFKRYIRGGIENLIKHGGAVLRSRELSLLGRIEALIQLSYSLAYPLGLIMIFLAILMYLFVPGALIDSFWCSSAGILGSVIMLLTFPYAALVISFIPSSTIMAITSLFTLIFLLRDRSKLRRADLERSIGTIILWNDNIVNCLVPLLETLLRRERVWQPTERTLKRVRGGEEKNIGERRRESMLRIGASAAIFAAFALILYLNPSINSIGVLIPAILWLTSAYLILKH